MSKGLILFKTLGNSKKYFEEFDRDMCNEHFILLRKWFIDRGYIFEVLSEQKTKDIKAIFFIDMQSVYPSSGGLFKKIIFYIKSKLLGTSSRDILKEVRTLKKLPKRYLLSLEPELICPANFDYRNARLFDTIFSWSPNSCGGPNNLNLIKHPVSKLNIQTNKLKKFSKRNLLLAISSNKGSFKKGSLDKKKFKYYKLFYENLNKKFDLYGFGWNQSFFSWFSKLIRGTKSRYFLGKLPFYKGVISNKFNVLVNYKFDLVFENSEVESFISEKIFDSIMAATIPIYYGAPDIKKYVPSKCFIDLRDFQNIKDLVEYIINFSEEKYEEFMEERESFLKSDKFKEFTSPEFVNKITKVCIKDGL